MPTFAAMPPRRLPDDRSRLLAFVAGALTVAMLWTLIWRHRLAAEPRPRLAPPTLAEALRAHEQPVPQLATTRAALLLAARSDAVTAWRYFEANADLLTGLVPVTAASGATTPWAVGSQVAAILSAEDLGLVSSMEGRRRLLQVVDSVVALGLAADGTLGRRYDARCLTPLDRDGRRTNTVFAAAPEEVARLAGPLALAIRRHPELSREGRPLLGRLGRNLDAPSGAVSRPGHGRYAARAFALAGTPFRADVEEGALVEGVVVPCMREAGDHCVAAADAVLLEALEFGLDRSTETAARAVYEAHRRRARRVGIAATTALEDLRRPPWLTATLVVTDGAPWATWPEVSAPAPLTTATKAAFGWAALFDDPLALSLRQQVEKARDVAAGWRFGLRAGREEGEPSADTNALVLEAIAYRVRGPLVGAPALH